MMAVAYDVTKPTFRWVESLWFRYTDLITKMRDIESEYQYRSNIDENGDIKAKGTTGDPTASAAISNFEIIQENQLYKNLNEQVKAIEYVYNSLPAEYKRLVHIRYWGSKTAPTWEYIAQQIGYSERHARRIRDMIVVATAEMLKVW